jgi:hypothetical protein
MKKIVFSAALVLGGYLITQAQSSTGQRSKNTTQVSGTSKKMKRIKNRQVVIADTGVYNRRMYKSKKSGQSATATGQEATGTNGPHANNPKNAARKEGE